MPIQILLVEDSPGDVRLIREAFLGTSGDINLHVAIDGVEAMQFLKKEGSFLGAPRPDFILLDLNLPKMDGAEVLAQIKGDKELRAIPAVILTTSDANSDILKSYDLHANFFLTKPVKLDQFESLIRSIYDFCLTTAKLPKRGNI